MRYTLRFMKCSRLKNEQDGFFLTKLSSGTHFLLVNIAKQKGRYTACGAAVVLSVLSHSSTQGWKV